MGLEVCGDGGELPLGRPCDPSEEGVAEGRVKKRQRTFHDKGDEKVI